MDCYFYELPLFYWMTSGILSGQAGIWQWAVWGDEFQPPCRTEARGGIIENWKKMGTSPVVSVSIHMSGASSWPWTY